MGAKALEQLGDRQLLSQSVRSVCKGKPRQEKGKGKVGRMFRLWMGKPADGGYQSG